MIKKAVFSYFNADDSFHSKCGFAKFSDFLFTTALSIVCASKHFPEVQMISSSWANDVFKQLKLPVTDYSNKLDEIKGISRFFWAYGKLIAYCEQKEPFVHLDNDVFLWQPLPLRILTARLCFQSKEPFNLPGYNYYKLLKPCFKKATVKPKVIVNNPVRDFAYNCGICGGNDLSLYEEWRKCSAEYIFAEENQDLFYKKYPQLLIHQNLFHEQYFLACLIKKYKLRDVIEVLADDAMQINQGCDLIHPRYTHLWGTTKRDQGYMAKVRMTLFYMDRDVFDSLNDFCINHKIL